MKAKSVKDQVLSSRLIPKSLKPEIIKLLSSSSRYDNGRVFSLVTPSSMLKISSKIKGCSLGADKKGFFVYTHRARSKSYPSYMKIPKKDIDFIESTG